MISGEDAMIYIRNGIRSGRKFMISSGDGMISSR